jgi:hypothetical protein
MAMAIAVVPIVKPTRHEGGEWDGALKFHREFDAPVGA